MTFEYLQTRTRLSIHLLGPFHVTLDGQPVIEFESNKVRALLAYLVVENARPLTREALAGLLWPEQPDRTARRNLSQALFNLRQALHDRDAEQPLLHVTRGTVQLNLSSDHWLDVSEFMAHLGASQAHPHLHAETCESCVRRLEQAIALYCGSFLQGLFVGDSVPFEEWVVLRRERFHRLTLDALYNLAKHYERSRDYDRARPYARRQVELEPWREEAHQQLMRLLARSGQRSAALAQYEICRRALVEELGVEPNQETIALYKRIRASGFAHYHNLPVQLTPFVGRAAELFEITERLENPACRLLTLVGPGGIGKTRLALRAAAEQIGAFLNGVYFVPLAPVSSTEFLAYTIAGGLDLSFYGDEEPAAQLLHYLREKEMLLVLDNLEHLVEGVELLVGILKYAPDVKILVTSRQPLNLQAEWLLEVRGLAVPEKDTLEGIENCSAVRLFHESASRADRGFSLSAQIAPAVTRICQLVEGLPLAIELAATWVRAYTCEQIVTQIERDLDFLVTSMRDVPARHRSLRVVFDQSWRLLSNAEREIATRLSVFRGPFQPEAARAVARATLSDLLALVDKSFLSQDQAGQYDFHPLLKHYAAEKLAETPDEQETARNLHCKHYARFMHERESELKGSQQQKTLAAIGAVIEDVRAAWQRAVSQRDLENITLLLEGCYWFYWARGWLQEGKTAFEQAATSVRASGEGNQLLLARIWTRQAEFYNWLGIYEQAKALLHQSIATLGKLNARGELAFALEALGRLDYWLGEYADARQQLQAGLVLYRKIGDQPGMAQALNSLASVMCDEMADYEQAKPLYEESLAISQRIGDRNGTAKVLINQGAIAQELGEYEQARRLYQESLRIYRELDYRYGVSAALRSLARVAYLMGEHSAAKILIQEGLELDRDTGNRNAILSSLSQLAQVTCELGENQVAQRHFEEALGLAFEMQALNPALDVLIGVAQLFEKEGKRERAAELLAFILFQTPGKELKTRVGDLLSKVEEGLSPDVAAKCRERGRAEPLETLVASLVKNRTPA